MSEKQDLREKNKQLRKEIFSIEKNNKIIENIKKLKCYQKAQHIMAFYPLKNEIDLRTLFSQTSKKWYLPKMDNENMLVCPFETENNLTIGKFNVKEPNGKKIICPKILDLIILPALATDKKGNRLGYGKGCYDKFIEQYTPQAILVVPIFENLLVEHVPTNKLDKKVNIIVTEKEIIEV